MEKTVVELFAGVGGFRVGLNHIQDFNEETGRANENNDYRFVWANQWEPSTKSQPAFNCYCTRFGNEHASNVNISEVDKTTIPDHALLVGGFPCQDYSVARSLSGEKGIEGKKGVLFWDIAKILEVKQPYFVLLENVDRLLKSPSKQRGRDFGVMLRTFNDNGYNVEWRVINASDYGARQRRRRTFIFAWKKNSLYSNNINEFNQQELISERGLFARTFPIAVDNLYKQFDVSSNSYEDTVAVSNEFSFDFQTAGCMLNGVGFTVKSTPIQIDAEVMRNIVEDNVDEKYYLTPAQREKFDYLKGAKKILREKNGVQYYYSEGPISNPDSLDLPGRTMLTSEGTVNRSTHIVDDPQTGRRRFITPVEAERLQHFPTNWTNTGMTDKQRYFMMGNALVTFIISTIEPVLTQIIDNE